jgi:hypothetical protein
MLRSFLTASILVMATLLAACATNVRANPVNQEPAGESLTAPEATASQTEKPASDPPADCPVTVPQDPPFVPPSPYDQLGFDGDFWHGSNSLWTAVPLDGTWRGLPYNPDGYTQKVFWWRDGYSISEEPAPPLAVTAERLDGKAPSVTGSRATNASAGDIGSAMLVGVDFPTPGCWKITGKSGEVELSFVVWVSP